MRCAGRRVDGKKAREIPARQSASSCRADFSHPTGGVLDEADYFIEFHMVNDEEAEAPVKPGCFRALRTGS